MSVFDRPGVRVDLSQRSAPPQGQPATSVVVQKQERLVTTSPSARRTTTLRARLGALLVVLALAVSACGGDDADASEKPTTSASPSETPTPTATPTPTPSAEPLSPFEDRAPVKAARAWAVAMATSINARDRSLAAVARVSTTRGLDQSRILAKEDIDNNVLRPGPQPFTPINVQIKGGVARLNTCYLTYGWAVDRKTRKPAEKRKVEPIVLELRRVGGKWKYDYGQQGTGDCQGVRITGVKWGS
jgi:hypothetical protein